MVLIQIAAFLFSATQGVAAIFQIKDRMSDEGKRSPHKRRDTGIAITLVLGTAVAGMLGVWMLDHPQKPQVIQRIVEKTIPCQKVMTGSASAKSGKSGISIAHSGNGDKYNLPATQKP